MTAQPLQIQLLLDGVWTTVDAYSAKLTRITRGLDPGGTWPRPNRLETVLANDDLSLDPSNPESALYGIAGRGTRARARMSGNTRTQAEAVSWRPARTLAHAAAPPGSSRGKASVDLVAEGVLGRITRWTEPLRSPMYRTASGRANLLGHWSLEDGSGATSLSNSLAGQPAGQLTEEVTLGDSNRPQGAQSTAKLGTGGALSGTFKTASATAGWQVVVSTQFPTAQTGTERNIITWRTRNGYSWRWRMNSTNYTIQADDPDGTGVLAVTVGHDGKVPSAWNTFIIAASQSGGNVAYAISWYQQNSTAVSFLPGTFAGAVGALRDWEVLENPGTTSGSYSHVYGLTTTSDNLADTTAQRVFNGYVGETAGARYGRITTEQGITRYGFGTSEMSQPMGPQRASTLLDLLRQIVDTDDCIIYDEPSDIALTMRPRREMLDQTPVLELTFGVDVADYVKRIDTRDAANVVTVSNADGGDYTVSLTSGPMSTQQQPDGIGEERRTVDVSVAVEASQLPELAGWHLAKGTLPDPRYDSITVNVVANPEQLTACQSAKPGDILTVDDLEPYQVRLMITGIIETIGHTSRTFEFETVSAEPFMAGRYDDSRFRYDAHSTLSAGVNATAVSLSVTAPTREDCWSTTATPYDVVVAGERMTVTTAGAVAGTGPFTQTLTVTRSVNGIQKAQDSGAEVHIATPGRYAL